MGDLLSRLDPSHRERTREQKHPEAVDPMLATLVDEPFDRRGWIFERKLDGERAIAHVEGGRAWLHSRNHEDLGPAYPELVEALESTAVDDGVFDGEIVAFEGSVTSYSRLQPRMQVNDPEEARRSGVAVYLYLFDLIHADGQGLEEVPLRERKRLLKHAIDFDDPLRFTPHRNDRGVEAHRQACERGWEGVIAKDGESSYVHSRSRKWLKFKCVARQELVIGGYTEPEGSRIGFGALLVGFYRDDRLIYAGKVGTGYDDETLRRLSQRLADLEQSDPPFDEGAPSGKGVHWVRPRLVAEVGFTEWTRRDRLRHPRFLGLRRDKDPEDVVKETPA